MSLARVKAASHYEQCAGNASVPHANDG